MKKYVDSINYVDCSDMQPTKLNCVINSIFLIRKKILMNIITNLCFVKMQRNLKSLLLKLYRI